MEASKPRQRGVIGRVLRACLWLVAVGAAVFVLSLLLYRFIPVPSTLMIGRWLTLQPVERQWMPLAQISPNLIRAVIAAEDQRYCEHGGVDWIELNTVLEDEDGPSRGASTLTMQTAKNVYLWPGRSYIRKGLEIPLAMLIDFAWGKQRTIEIYLNVAEWGEGLYGAEAAAQRYFRKPAARLTGAEAARLAGALPNPILRNPAQQSRGLQSSTGRIQRRVGQLGPLGDCAVPAGTRSVE